MSCFDNNKFQVYQQFYDNQYKILIIENKISEILSSKKYLLKHIIIFFKYYSKYYLFFNNCFRRTNTRTQSAFGTRIGIY